MSTSNLLDLIKFIKNDVNNQDWEALKQHYLDLKNYIATVNNPIIREMAELNEFVASLEELLVSSQSQNKMIFQAKLEFIQIKIFSIENIVENLNMDFQKDLDDLSNALGELGVSEEEIKTPIIKETTFSSLGMEKDVSVDSKPPEILERSSITGPPTEVPMKIPPTAPPKAISGPPTGVPMKIPPTAPPKATSGPPTEMSMKIPPTAPPKARSGPPSGIPMKLPPTAPPKPISVTASTDQPTEDSSLEYIEASMHEEKREEPVPFSFLSKAPPPSMDSISSKKKKEATPVHDRERKSEITGAQIESVSENVLQRNTRISYFDQMNPDTNYTLKIKISKQQIDKIQSETVTHVYSSFEVEKTEQKPPIVKIIPFFPGCLITPNQAEVNIEEDNLEVLFWITPLVLGKIDSCVEFWFEGKRIDKVETPTKIVTQTISKVMATAGVVTGVVPAALEFLNIDVNGYLSALFSTYWPQMETFFSVWGILIIEIIIVSALIGLGAFFYLKKRPKETEVEK
ncbi:MAG: hypothetical protein EAX96_10975 [Candidatus Lokiarchaeota archaeon]|nr:hypothetical protein [Candidatus Lokiarchaeota archaeon]